MKAFERYVFGSVDAIRPWLLMRGLLLVLAFDCWLDLASHGGRYGFNDFNVAHFAILDAVLPVPTSGTYVSTVLLTGLLSFTMAVTRPTRVGVGGVFALYTYGWVMSMLDSYQHHYLISILLFSMIFFPMPSSAEVFEHDRPEKSRGLGGALFAFGLLEVTLGLSGVDSPLSALLTSGAAVETPSWLWVTRFGAMLLGGLVAFLPGEAKEAETVEPESTPTPKKRKKKKGKKGKKGKRRSAAVSEGRGEGGEESKERKPEESAQSKPMVSAWAYVSFCISCAIVYFYTAVTKLSDDWREGHALRRLSRTDLLDGLEARALNEGLPLFGAMSAEEFWKLMAGGAILVQIVTCVGYLLAPTQDRMLPGRKPWQRALFLVVFLGAPMSFHLGAEAGLGLDIGWFSFYMMLVAMVVFLPAAGLRRVMVATSAPWRTLSDKIRGQFGEHRPAMGIAIVAAGGIAIAVGSTIDMPGSLDVGLASATGLFIATAWAFRRERLYLAGGWALGLGLGAALMMASIARSDVRFDFYRFVGGEHRRHGEHALALEAYEKANAYVHAPYCLYRGGGRRAELVECFVREDRAERIAERFDDLSVRRRDRQRQEDEMRRLVDQAVDREVDGAP